MTPNPWFAALAGSKPRGMLFPQNWNACLEVTATLRIGYRSPGTVGFETKMLVANTGVTNVHWAWADEFQEMGLSQQVTHLKEDLGKLAKQVPAPARSPLALLVGEELGPYTPTNICVPYGATHDPMSAYTTVALLGLPITCCWQPQPTQPAVLCAAYISREMIRQIDDYVSTGGVAMLDAIAARCYQAYGGSANFAIEGPHSSHAYEIGPGGTRETMISRCPSGLYLSDGVGHSSRRLDRLSVGRHRSRPDLSRVDARSRQADRAGL